MADHHPHVPPTDPFRHKKPTVRLDPAKLASARDQAAQNPATHAPGTPPPPPTHLPADSLPAALHSLFRQCGPQLWESRKTLRNLLADELGPRLGEFDLEIDTLGLLLEKGFPARLLAAPASQLPEFLRAELERLARPASPHRAPVAAAIRCWAAALRPDLGPASSASAGPLPLATAPSPSLQELLAMAQDADAQQAEAERLERQAHENARQKLADQKRDFDLAYPAYQRLLDNPLLSPAQLATAWQHLAACLRVTLPADPAELVWTATGPDVQPRRIRATRDKPFTNTLGMKFVPVAGTDALFSVWDTRVQDYEAFVKATGRSWEKPSFTQERTHPAVNVSWDDAQVFAKWLTEKEQKETKLTAAQSYRLPKDWEWSVAVGLNETQAGTAKSKDGKIENVYPWAGGEWPPTRGVGNYGQSLKVDDYEYTSPVGSFAANKFGLYDMGGNVWQWCEDFYDESSFARVLRGGSWYGIDSDFLLSSFRLCNTSDDRGDDIGFRCVLVGVSSRKAARGPAR